jgi:hypothetical protein
MVEQQPSKLNTRVRFPSPAPVTFANENNGLRKSDKTKPAPENSSWSRGGPNNPDLSAAKSYKPRRWKGELAKPIEAEDLPFAPWHGLLGSMEHKTLPPDVKKQCEADYSAELLDAIQKVQAAKMPALLQEYGLHKLPPETAYTLLALNLAQEFVPGFKVRPAGKKPGQRRRWNEGEYGEIMTGIAKIEATTGCTRAEAVKQYFEANPHDQTTIERFRIRLSEMKANLDPRWIKVTEGAVTYEFAVARGEIEPDPFGES